MSTCPSCKHTPHPNGRINGADWRVVAFGGNQFLRVCNACAQTVEAEKARLERETPSGYLHFGPFVEHLYELMKETQ